MIVPRLELPPDFDHVVRLFPLGEYVAFPHNVMPLHIFESRYREMFEDAIQGDQLIAMATLLPGHSHDYYTRPPIAPTVCIGQILTHEKTEEGTYTFLLAGVARARVEHEIEPVRSFRRGKVTVIEETGHSEPDPQAIATRLVSLVKDTLPSAEKLLDEVDRGRISIAGLTDVLAFHLPLPTVQKLELLAEANGVARVRRLVEQWPLEQREPNDPPRRFRADFSDN
jgi:Lon protease-like protein